MSAAGFDSDSHKREWTVSGKALVNRYGFFAFACVGHSLEALPVPWIPDYLGLDFSLKNFWSAAANCYVFFGNPIVVQEFVVQEFLSSPVFCRYNDSAGIFVKAMDYPWPPFCK